MVFEYDIALDRWLYAVRLRSHECATGAKFGTSVDLVGDDLLVGAPGTDPLFSGASGQTVIHLREHLGTWYQAAQWTGPAFNEDFGRAVAIADDGSDLIFLASDPRANGVESAVGETYAFGPLSPSTDCNGNGIEDACETCLTDCNENGVPDDCDIASGLDSDVNANNIPDGCEFVDCDGNGTNDIFELDGNDCNGNGVLDVCELAQTLDIVFVVDTSGSSQTELTQFCGGLVPALESELLALGHTAEVTIVTLGAVDEMQFPCVDGTVADLYGTAIPFAPACCEVLLDTESWAAGTAIIADRFEWDQAYRFVIPVSDECPWQGGSCTSFDEDSRERAGYVACINDVFVMPIAAPGADGDVLSQMEDLADATNGQEFEWSVAGNLAFVADLADAIADRLVVHDSNADGILDQCQFATSSTLGDCNGNGIDDALDIALGLSLAGTSGLPVECEVSCSQNGDVAEGLHVIDFNDLLAVLAAWGPCVDCPEDFVGDDDQVGFAELLSVLSNWGWCADLTGCIEPLAVNSENIPPSSIGDCIQKYGLDPVKLEKCIEAMLLADTP